jgi:hypothetical protein
MTLFMVLVLKEHDDRVALVDALVDTLTQAKYLKVGESLHFSVVQNTLLVYRSFPVTKHGR